MKKVLLLFLIISIGSVGAEQPSVKEIEDNFGNTHEHPEDIGKVISGIPSPEQQIHVKENTNVTLCVTEVGGEDNIDSVDYSWRAARPEDPYLHRGENDRCATWILDREDYETKWTFRVKIDNGDEIQPGGRYDAMSGVIYSNLSLSEGETSVTDKKINEEEQMSSRQRLREHRIEQKDIRDEQEASQTRNEDNLSDTITGLFSTESVDPVTGILAISILGISFYIVRNV